MDGRVKEPLPRNAVTRVQTFRELSLGTIATGYMLSFCCRVRVCC
jgi:hypothetical protein